MLMVADVPQGTHLLAMQLQLSSAARAQENLQLSSQILEKLQDEALGSQRNAFVLEQLNFHLDILLAISENIPRQVDAFCQSMELIV